MSRYGEMRAELQQLHWGDGLTREEMLRQNPELPRDLVAQLPARFRFRNTGEVMSYFDHLRRHGVLRTDPTLEPVTPPMDWGNAPTGRVYDTPDLSHGVGSGATTVETGSSGQTGSERSGPGEDEAEYTP